MAAPSHVQKPSKKMDRKKAKKKAKRNSKRANKPQKTKTEVEERTFIEDISLSDTEMKNALLIPPADGPREVRGVTQSVCYDSPHSSLFGKPGDGAWSDLAARVAPALVDLISKKESATMKDGVAINRRNFRCFG
jgi:hypothetical protein